MITPSELNAPKKVKTYTDAVDGFPIYWRRDGDVTGKRIIKSRPNSIKLSQESRKPNNIHLEYKKHI